MLAPRGMAGHEHEALIRLFRDDPSLVPTVLSDWLGRAVPDGASCELTSADLSEALPTELRADAVFVLKHGAGAPSLAVVLEVQRDWDDRKHWSWPAYAVLTRARHQCHAVVLVITLDPATAARARRPIPLDETQSWRALVLGPESIPRIADREQMKAHPTMGVLSALAHARELEDLPVVMAALHGLPASSLDPDLVGYYLRVMVAAFGPALRAALEEAMQQGEEIPPGPIGQFFLNRGRQEGLAEGRQEGLAEGRQEGLAEGQEKGLARALLAILRSRGLPLTTEQQSRIESCSDPDLLEQWIGRAVSAATTEEILAPQ